MSYVDYAMNLNAEDLRYELRTIEVMELRRIGAGLGIAASKRSTLEAAIAEKIAALKAARPRPTTGPEAAVLDALDDVKAAYELLRKAEQRLAGSARLQCSALAAATLTQARAAAGDFVYQIESSRK